MGPDQLGVLGTSHLHLQVEPNTAVGMEHQHMLGTSHLPLQVDQLHTQMAMEQWLMLGTQADMEHQHIPTAQHRG